MGPKIFKVFARRGAGGADSLEYVEIEEEVLKMFGGLYTIVEDIGEETVLADGIYTICISNAQLKACVAFANKIIIFKLMSNTAAFSFFLLPTAEPLYKFTVALSGQALCDLINATEFLQFKDLYNYLCEYLASRIVQQSSEDMAKFMGTTVYTPAERRAAGRNSSWVSK